MTTLQQIIQEIKTVALASGFKFVSENKVNLNDKSDTQLPVMYIKLNEVTYDKFSVKTIEETYPFSLLMVISCSQNPLTDLKTMQDLFMLNFMNSSLLQGYFLGDKITFNKSTITNDIQTDKELGGHSCILDFTIENVIKFGGDCD